MVTLQSMMGDTPSGSGVSVAMTEALVNGGYTPMTEMPDFAGKHFAFRSGEAGNSAHATWVAQNFFGLSTSIAPGINTIELYEASDFMADGFLHAGDRNRSPDSSLQNSRVGNHSWISNAGSINATVDILERVDWVIERDEYIQVVGVNNGDINMNPIVSNAFNAIAVGRTDGQHAVNTLPLTGIYTGYRTKPDIVAPAVATSFATPIVSAASAMLVELGHTAPSLSESFVAPARFSGTVVYNAETSEVVKAALLAGASRLAFNSADSSALVDYRQATSRQAKNGLDERYGAGQLNVHNSVSLMIEGERSSQADGGTEDVGYAGFDYDPHFGGANGSNSSGVYDFTAGWTGQTLTASLVWNAQIDINRVKLGQYASAGTLYNLDLSLFDISSGTPVLVASSTSKDQNTENLWTSLVGGRRYRLEVSRAGTQTPFDWDYGLAWSTIGTIGWHGGGPWNTSSPSWTKGTFSASYLPGEHVVFSDWGLDGHVVIDGTVAPGSVLVENQAVPYTFSGGAITGATGIIKRGAGQVTLANANSYAGETLIQQGTLAIATDGALGLASKPTVVSENAALVFSDSVNYTLPEPLSIGGHGPAGQGAIENLSGVSSFAGPLCVAKDSTIGIADGELMLTGNVEIATGTRLYKTGTGILSLAGGLAWGPASAISADAGLLRLEPAAGSAVSVSKVSPTLLILGGAVRIDATHVDPLTDSQDPTVHADVINDAINGFVVEAGSVAVEQLIGAGTTHVGDGAELIVSQIEQTDLSIAPGGIVRLRPGGGTSLLTSLNLDLGIALATAGDSLAPPPDLFIKPPDATGLGLLLASSAASANSSAVSAVPEPGTLGLTAAALASILIAMLRRRRIL